jgi:hypothetical protein
VPPAATRSPCCIPRRPLAPAGRGSSRTGAGGGRVRRSTRWREDGEGQLASAAAAPHLCRGSRGVAPPRLRRGLLDLTGGAREATRERDAREAHDVGGARHSCRLAVVRWETMVTWSGGSAAGAVRAASSCLCSSICRPGGAADSSATQGSRGGRRSRRQERGGEGGRRIRPPRLALLLRLAPPPRSLEVNGEMRGVRGRRCNAREAAMTGSSGGNGGAAQRWGPARRLGVARRQREATAVTGSSSVRRARRQLGWRKPPTPPTPHTPRECSTGAARCKLQQLLRFLLEPL